MPGSVAFLNKTYDDAMALVIESRNYIAYRQALDERDLEPPIRLQISLETMRVTARLTQVMAWLLVQKAVDGGELTREQAMVEALALSGEAICLDTAAEELEGVPNGLKSLLERSHALYLRISRLDSQIRRQTA
jgi:regulator of CtrA degradation